MTPPTNPTDIDSVRRRQYQSKDERKAAIERGGSCRVIDGPRLRLLPPPAKAAAKATPVPAKAAPKPATADVWSGDPAKLFAARDKAMAAGRKQ